MEKEPKSLPSTAAHPESSDISTGHVTDEVVVSDNGIVLFPQPIKGDALDPLNWSFGQKHAILAIVMALYFMFTYLTTTTVPSFADLQEQYSVTVEQINWTVAIPALGLAVGPLIWASPADIIGRRPILILGTAIAFISTIGAAVARNFPGYMAARFFQGLGVSPASNVGLAIINDVFFEHERGQKVGLWVLAIDLGVYFGPLVGGFVNLASPAWIQWLCAILFGAILVAEIVFLPETLYPRSLLSLRVRSSGGESTTMTAAAEKGEAAAAANNNNNNNSNTTITPPPPSSEEFDNIPRTKKLPFANMSPLPGFKHPKIYRTLVLFIETFKYSVVPISVMTYCFGWYWWLLSAVTVIPIAYANYSPQVQGLFFIGLIVGTVLSEVLCSGSLSDWIIIQLTKRKGHAKNPEMRIWLAYPGAILTGLGLVIWGLSIDRGYHWMVGQVAFALFGAGIQMGNTAVCSYIFDAYPKQSMAILTFYAVILNLSAFIAPFFIVPWVEVSGFTVTFGIQAAVTVFFCVPALALLHVYGSYLRDRSGAPTWVNPEYDDDDTDTTHAERAS